MTGFARVDGAAKGRSWVWEIKSVNARGLEMRFRLPAGYDDMELGLRNAAQKKLSRGSVSAGLTLGVEEDAARFRVNEAALEAAMAEVKKISARLNCELPRPEGVLALRGVMEPMEAADDDKSRKALIAAVGESFDKGLDALVAARRTEGAVVAAALADLLDETERLAGEARNLAAAAPEALRARVASQLQELLAGAAIADDRLAQEAALLAVKADIREELDRLLAHVVAGRALLKSNRPVGRQLDFLTQELNREANTLCAKSPDLDIKRIGLDLKKVVDQLREHVQNIE